MLVKVLRSFPYSNDGVTTKGAIEGAVIDVSEALFAGLEAEGFVEPAEEPDTEKKPDQEISDDWQELGWDDLRELANSLSDETIRSKAAAEAVITAELERRELAIAESQTTA